MNAIRSPEGEGRLHRRRRRFRGLMLACLVLVAGSLAASDRGAAQAASAGSAGTLHEVGVIDDVATSKAGEVRPSPMIVDTARNLGFSYGRHPTIDGDSRGFILHDLESFEFLDAIRNPNYTPLSVLAWAVDEQNSRLLTVFGEKGSGGNGVLTSCATQGQRLSAVRYVFEDGKWRFPRPSPTTSVAFPCPNQFVFHADAASIYQDPTTGRRKLYLTGSYANDAGARALVKSLTFVDTMDNDGQTLLVRQFDMETLESGDPTAALDWEVDLRYAGCGRRVGPYFVGRTGDSVVTYCTDPTPAQYANPLGAMGYVVRIDLDDDDQPKIEGDEPVPDPVNPDYGIVNADVRRMPTFSGPVIPNLDAESGRMLLLTNDRANGNAVWVYDVFAERFIGAMTHGRSDAAEGKTGAGFDLSRGRAYLFSPSGFIVGPARQDPPLAGLHYEVLAGADDILSTDTIAVAPGLRRLFVPIVGRGYVVLQDDVPEPPSPVELDPDRNTTQVPERAGLTIANTSGAAIASGLRVAVAGGLTKPLDQADPSCSTPDVEKPSTIFDSGIDAVLQAIRDNNQRSIFEGRCIWEQVASRGHRDFSLGSSVVEAGTSAGASAEGQGLAFGTNDQASDRDVKALGECYRATVSDVTTQFASHFGGEGAATPFEALFGAPRDDDHDGQPDDEGSPYYQICDQTQEQIRAFDAGGVEGPDLSAGTRGRDHRGFPAHRASCSRSIAPAESDEKASVAINEADAGAFRSRVICDPARVGAWADSEVGGGTPPTSTDLALAVGASGSRVDTVRTAGEGTVTVARAWAQDVTVGPLHVTLLRSVATTKAHGHTGSSQADLRRQWCGVVLDGQVVEPGCMDLDPGSPTAGSIMDAVNSSLQRARLSVPQADRQETPGGYQAVVTKDPAERAADRSVNDDDGHTVSALQVVLYNDGSEGRSRVVLQFAGVHAESRYGVVEIPRFTVPPFSTVFDDFVPPSYVAPVAGTPGTPGSAAYVIRRAGTTVDEYIIEGQAASRVSAAPPSPEVLFESLRRGPLAIFQGLLRWMVNNPTEAALLFLLWSLLAAPVYLVIRRRAFERAIAIEVL